ncbi:MAG: hypothetical protein KY476_11390 [Planctomycetes bacterium]|nr:hypothetical protein [Planctomycetota bacterium]
MLRVHWLAAIALLLIPSSTLVLAQPLGAQPAPADPAANNQGAQPAAGDPAATGTSHSGAVRTSDAAVREREMTEDVEVLRIILERTIASLYADRPRHHGSASSGFPGGAEDGYGEAMDSSMMMGLSQMSGYESGYGMGAAPGEGSASAVLSPVLGASVFGGVVYQVEVPPLALPDDSERLDASACTYLQKSQWERTAFELRGDFTKTDCRECHDTSRITRADGARGPNLSREVWRRYLNQSVTGAETGASAADGGVSHERVVDALVALLAENGHHFRHLRGDERVSIAVTVRTKSLQPIIPGGGSSMFGSGMPGMSGMGGGSMGGPASAFGGPMGMFSSAFGDEPFPRVGGLPRSSAGGAGNRRPLGSGGGPSDAGNDELAGNLALRQGNAGEAVEAYERALLRAFGHTGSVAKDDRKAVLGSTIPPRLSAAARRIAWKLLAAYVQADKFDTARFFTQHLGKKSDLFSAEGDDDAPAKAEEKISLPGRVVVSATKAQLDDVAAGRLSSLLFRQAVEVRVFDPTAAPAKGSAAEAAPTPGGLSGTVLTVSDELVEMSLGARDGVRRGMQFHVVRGEWMIATVEVVRVESDRAVARVTSHADTPAAVDGTIRRGDRVVSPEALRPSAGGTAPRLQEPEKANETQ